MMIMPFVGLGLTVGRFEARFLLPALPQLALLVALGWGALTVHWSRLQRAALFTLLTVALAAGGTAQFMATAWRQPLALPLPPAESKQYLEQWSAGVGSPQVAAYIAAQAAAQPTDLVVTDIGQIVFISTYLDSESGLYTLHDFVSQNLRIKVLYEGLNDPFASLADPCRQVFLLAKLPDDADRIPQVTAPLEKIATFPGPGEALFYELYHVFPTEAALAVHGDNCR